MQIAGLVDNPEVYLIVLVVVVLLFGSSKIPKIARGLGSAKTEFEKGAKEGQSTATEVTGGTDGAKGADGSGAGGSTDTNSG